MRGNILIVEDNADWRELIAGLLQRDGHSVEAVASLPEALQHVDDTRDLDLAIVDIRLVEADDADEQGMQVLAGIRARQPFTRVVMISGHGTMELQRRAFRQFNAFDFFRKEEFDSDEFRRTVRDAVEQAGRERAARKENDYMRGQRYESWQRKQEG